MSERVYGQYYNFGDAAEDRDAMPVSQFDGSAALATFVPWPVTVYGIAVVPMYRNDLIALRDKFNELLDRRAVKP